MVSVQSNTEKIKLSDSQWIGIGTPSNGDVLQLSQFMTPLANKVWQPTVPAYHANPFMVNYNSV